MKCLAVVFFVFLTVSIPTCSLRLPKMGTGKVPGFSCGTNYLIVFVSEYVVSGL